MTEREKLERKYDRSLTRLVGGASYILCSENDKPVALMFRPKSKKPWRKLKFENNAQREDVVRKFAEDMAAEFEARRERRDDRKSAVREFRDSVKVGDLFAYKWGGVKRRVWFYVVVEKRKDEARLLRIGAKEVLGFGGSEVVPDTTVCYTDGVIKKYGPGHFDMPEGLLEKTTADTRHLISR